MDETIWKLTIQQGNSISALDDFETKLVAIRTRFEDVAAKATQAANNFKSTSTSIAALATKASEASQNFTKLDSLQSKVAEATRRLEIAVAQETLALKKADEASKDSKVSTEQLAIVKARAALATEKVRTAQGALAQAMQKTRAESEKLSDSLKENSKESEQVAGASKSAGISLASLGGIAGTAAAAGFAVLTAAVVAAVAAIASTIGPAEDFEETMNLIGTSNDLTAQEVDKLTASVHQLSGPQTRKRPQDLADALYYVLGAGYDTAQGLEILKLSAQQASVGLTQTEVVANAATSVLKAFPGLETAYAFDVMTKAVFTGKTEWETFGPAIGRVSLFAQQAGVSFEEATTALSVLTNTMPSTEQAATSLTSLLQTSSRFSDLAERARSLGLAFDENAYKSLNFIDRLKYLYQITGNNTEAVAQLLQQEESIPAITALLTNGAIDYSKALDAITNSAGTAQQAFEETAEGSKASWATMMATLDSFKIKVGTAFLPAVGEISRGISLVITDVAGWIEKNQILERVTQGISDVIGFLKPLISDLITSFKESGALETWANALGRILAKFEVFKDPAMEQVKKLFQGIKDVADASWPVIETRYIPAIEKLADRIINLAQRFMEWNERTHATEKVFDLLTEALPRFIEGAARVAETVETTIRWFEKLANTIRPIRQFVFDVIKKFQELYDKLVGHSIIPDLVNGIINWFWKLVNDPISAINSMKDKALGVMSDLGNKAYTAGSNVVQQIASGIRGSIQWVKDAIASVTQWIADHLPHSPAKLGPLKDLELQGSLIPEQIAQGMQRGIPQIQSALGGLTTPISTSLALVPPPIPSFASLPQATLSSNDSTRYLAQMVALLSQIVTLQQQNRGNVTNNTYNAMPIDMGQINQAIQALSGWSYENIARGAL